MSTQDVLLDIDGGQAVITLNRPDALNALTRGVRQGLIAALDAADQDSTVRLVVLRGAGRAFSVGQDLKEMQHYYEEHGPELGRLVQDEYIPIVQTMRDLSKPIIAVLEGAAVGGGMAIALAADFRVILNRAQLVPGFVNVALAPDTGTTFLLARSVGYARALSLCLTGQAIRSGDMVQWGLAAEAHETPESLADELSALAAKLVSGPTRAYAAIRRLFDQAAALDFPASLALERDVQDRLAHTNDHQESVVAFLGKRTPTFRGE